MTNEQLNERFAAIAGLIDNLSGVIDNLSGVAEQHNKDIAALFDGQRVITEGLRTLIDSQRDLADDIGGLKEAHRNTQAALDSLIRHIDQFIPRPQQRTLNSAT